MAIPHDNEEQNPWSWTRSDGQQNEKKKHWGDRRFKKDSLINLRSKMILRENYVLNTKKRKLERPRIKTNDESRPARYTKGKVESE